MLQSKYKGGIACFTAGEATVGNTQITGDAGSKKVIDMSSVYLSNISPLNIMQYY